MKTILLYFVLSIAMFFNASYAQEFNTFWVSFNKQIQNKEYLLKKIEFPYAYSCNYLSDGEISKAMFQEMGTKVIMNGNAFISNCFFGVQVSKMKYKNGYINEFLKGIIRFSDDIYADTGPSPSMPDKEHPYKIKFFKILQNQLWMYRI